MSGHRVCALHKGHFGVRAWKCFLAPYLLSVFECISTPFILFTHWWLQKRDAKHQLLAERSSSWGRPCRGAAPRMPSSRLPPWEREKDVFSLC